MKGYLVSETGGIMNQVTEILLGAGALFYMLLVCASDAFDDLSGGRVRKIEGKDPELAEILDGWLEKSERMRMTFRLLLVVSASVFSVSVYLLAPEKMVLNQVEIPVRIPILAVSIILLSAIGDLLSKFLLPKADLFIIRHTVPGVLLFARMIMPPFELLLKPLNKRVEEIRDEIGTEGRATLEDEILDMMEDEPDGELEEGEKRMIKGIFDLSDKSVKEIMTPRVDVHAIPLSSSVEEARKVFVSTGHSRIPVYGRSIDEIRGIVYAKDFLAVPSDKKSLTGMIHMPIFIPETKAVDELLEEIQRTHNHFAVVIDEYGGTSGIVTFEDIIEEIIGDVRDEYDSPIDAAEKPQLKPDGSVELEARTTVSDVNEILGIEIPEVEHADTIGGYICAELGRIPEQGEVFTMPDLFKAFILKADKRKIQRLRISIPEEENE